jgi:tetratricopeptide (TPR) repeat protein
MSVCGEARGLAVFALVLLVSGGAAALELPKNPWALAGQENRAAFVDVLPLCMPSFDGADFEAPLRLAAEGQLEQALRFLPHAGSEEPATLMLRALLEARSRPATARQELRTALLRAAQQYADPEAKTCARLERARLALLSGHAGEAFGDLALARRSRPKAAAEPKRQIDYYHAEALFMAGREAEAIAAYRELGASPIARVGWVAKFRIALTSPGLAWPAVRSELDRGRRIGVDVDAWSAVVGERALQSGHLEEALAWLSRAEELLPNPDLVTLRKADVLLAMRKVDLARRILVRVEHSSGSRVARELAAIRLAHKDVGDADRAEERLALAARSNTPGVSALALEGLTYLYLSRSRPEAALDAVGRWRSLAPRGGTPGLDAATDAAVQLAVGSSDDCITVIRRLAGGRDVWLPSVSSAEPMLRLGACASELGLSSTAADVYRALGRRFPDHFGPELTLHIARASWDLGERAVVESLLAAHERSRKGKRTTFDQQAPWLLLRAEMAVSQGRTKEAQSGLMQLVAAAETPPRERELALAMLIELPEEPAELAAALRSGLQNTSDLSPNLQALGWLRLGDLLEEQKLTPEARQAYRQAAELLPTGTARGRVLHALARSSATRAERNALLEELAAGTSSGAWARLAKGELHLAHLRRVLKRDEE